MTEKRFRVEKQAFDGYCIVDTHFDGYYTYEEQDLEKLCETLNDLSDENEQLKTQLQNTSDQRNEFHRGLRENANRVGKLEKENEQLRQRNNNQYNQLTELWEIIEEENWEKLIAMKKQLKEDEERLRNEWKCYE